MSKVLMTVLVWCLAVLLVAATIAVVLSLAAAIKENFEALRKGHGR